LNFIRAAGHITGHGRDRRGDRTAESAANEATLATRATSFQQHCAMPGFFTGA
jgi:hypothetical protein